MGQASFSQASFLGGEWSPMMQGRTDLPKYRMSMNLCQNAIVIEEGAAQRRSGTQLLAPTRSGEPGRVVSYAPTQDAPYIMEFTDNHLRFFQGWNLYMDANPPAVVSISSASPTLVTVGTAVDWATGDQGMFVFPSGVFPGATTGTLQNRQFTVTMVSDTTFTLTDSITGDDISGVGITLNAGHLPTFARVTDLASPYTNGSWKTLRWIPFLSAQNASEGALINGSQPYLLTAATPGENTTSFSLSPLSFTDGPYLDPINGAVATMTVGSGSPTFRVVEGFAWQPASGLQGRYNTGVMVMYQGFAYVSTEGGSGGTNTDNVPGTNSAWVLVDPTAPDPAPTYWPAWSSGGSYTPWNGTGSGSVVYFVDGVNSLWIAVNGATNSFSNTQPSTAKVTSSLNYDWWPISYEQVSDNISGIITLELSFAVWASTTTYAIGDTSSFGGISYISLTNGNTNNEPDVSAANWAVANAGVAFGPNGAQPTDVGRLLRLFYQPAPWSATTTYVAGQNVVYNNAYYSALISNTGNQPDISLIQWQAVQGVAFWTSTIVVGVSSPTTIQVQITGAPLTDGTPITLYEVGVYTNTNNQWPTCGLFYQGRLWLAGAVPNRIDSSTSDDPLTWTPTAPDGTVADNNGISLVFNSEDDETILWMKGVQQGILVGTRTREWLINSSATNDPITPATVEISPVTKYGGAFVEPKATGLATVFVQKFKRQLLEMVANVFSGKYNAPNIALPARHLTATGIEELTYQEELAPVIWARMADGSLSGCTYRRLSAINTDNPVLLTEPSTFAAWHRHTLGTGRNVTSITTTLTPDGSLDQLAMVTQATSGQQTAGPTVPQLWIKVDDGNWNGSAGADPTTGIGGVDLSSMTGPFYQAFSGDTGFGNSLAATFAGGWSATDNNSQMTVSNGTIPGTIIIAENALASLGAENNGWVRSASPIPTNPNVLVTSQVFLNSNYQDLFVGIATGSANLALSGEIPSQMTNVAVLVFDDISGTASLVVNAVTVATGIPVTGTSTITIATLYPTPQSFLSYVEVMQPLADVNDTLETAWYADGAAPPSSQELADTNTEVVFYGYNSVVGNTVAVWAAGLDLGDYTVAEDGSVTVPIGAANGLFSLALAQSYDGAIPTVIGAPFTSRGQIVRPATPQETGSRIGPGQGETRRVQMMTALLYNTQGISFGTDFAYMRPAALTSVIGGPTIPITQLYTGIYQDTVEDTYGFDGMLAWEVTRPYPAMVCNIGGWLHTQER